MSGGGGAAGIMTWICMPVHVGVWWINKLTKLDAARKHESSSRNKILIYVAGHARIAVNCAAAGASSGCAGGGGVGTGVGVLSLSLSLFSHYIHARYYCTLLLLLLLLAILATHSLAAMRVAILPVSPTPARGLNHLVMLRYKNIRDRSLLMETDGATRTFLSTSPLYPLDTMVLFAKLPVSCAVTIISTLFTVIATVVTCHYSDEEAVCLIDILPLV